MGGLVAVFLNTLLRFQIILGWIQGIPTEVGTHSETDDSDCFLTHYCGSRLF